MGQKIKRFVIYSKEQKMNITLSPPIFCLSSALAPLSIP